MTINLFIAYLANETWVCAYRENIPGGLLWTALLWGKKHMYRGEHRTEVFLVVDGLPPMERKAIAAFSGGVDSIFTILRHKTKALGNASYPLNDAVLMVDFHSPLFADQMDLFKKRTKPFLDELGIMLLSIKTNLKELGLQAWEDSFMAQLACCLNNYSDGFYYALVASSEAYSALVLPWGSNPATDYLLSGDTMQLVHDGAGYSRTEKVARIAENRTATLAVQVCWEGQDAASNCGVCEKCIRTQLNFRAVGVEHASCFGQPLDLGLIDTLQLRNDAQANELRSIYAYATKAGISAGWVRALGGRIDRYDNAAPKLEQTVACPGASVGFAERDRRNAQLEISGLNAELAAAQARLASAFSSRSWRLTAPLRWCDAIQRRLCGSDKGDRRPIARPYANGWKSDNKVR